MSLFKKKNERSLFTAFISYFLIFLIPFLLLTTVLYYSAIIGLKQQLYSTNQNSLKQAMNLLDERLKDLEKLTDTIQFNPKLSSFMLNHPFYSLDSNNELGRIQANHSFIEEMYIYYDQDKKFYSKNGSYDLSTFQFNKYETVAFEAGELEENLTKNHPKLNATLYSSGVSDKLFQYYVPLKNSGITYGNVLFVLNNNELEKMMNMTSNDLPGFTYLLDESYSTLLSLTESGKEHANLKIEKETLNNIKLEYADKQYDLSSFKSEISGITLALLVEDNQFLKPVIQTRNLFYLLIALIFILGSLFSYILGLKKYLPMKKIEDSFEKILSKESLDFEDGNRLFFENKLNLVLKNHLELNQIVSEQKVYLLNYFLESLISGHYREENQLKYEMEKLDFKLAGKAFFVVVMSSEWSENKEENTKIKTVFIDQFPRTIKGTTYHLIELATKKQIVMLGCTTKAEINSLLAVSELKQFSQTFLPAKLSFTVGNFYENLLYINRSYIDALTAAEYFKDTDRDIIYYEEISDRQVYFSSIPIDSKSKLHKSLMEGDEVVAKEVLESIFSKNTIAQMSIYEKRYYCYDVISTVFNCVSQENQQSIVKNFDHLMSSDVLDDIHEELKKITDDFCSVMNFMKEKETKDLGQKIMKYIHENYASMDLSLEAIAVNFDFSVSYLSRVVKEQVGITFSNYVQELRLVKIKEELIYTPKTIKEIVNDAGYHDVSNYTRKFKQIIGVTPGQYRKENRKENSMIRL